MRKYPGLFLQPRLVTVEKSVSVLCTSVVCIQGGGVGLKGLLFPEIKVKDLNYS